MQSTKKTLPLYQRRIVLEKESQDWPTWPELQANTGYAKFLQENPRCRDCGDLYGCVVMQMKCEPFEKRLWGKWKSIMG